jgi:hypothetical protein
LNNRLPITNAKHPVGDDVLRNRNKTNETVIQEYAVFNAIQIELELEPRVQGFDQAEETWRNPKALMIIRDLMNERINQRVIATECSSIYIPSIALSKY